MRGDLENFLAFEGERERRGGKEREEGKRLSFGIEHDWEEKQGGRK